MLYVKQADKMFDTILTVSIISTLLLFSKISTTFLNPTIYNFKVHRLEQCAEQKKWNISLNFVNFKVMGQDGVNANFSGIMDIIKPIQINFRLSVHGLLCDSPQDRTCKHRFIRKFGYICRKLHEKGRPWYDFLKEKYICPIPIGYYNMGTMRININSLSHLPLGVGYWVIKVIGYQGKEVIVCVYSELEITSTIKRGARTVGRRGNTGTNTTAVIHKRDSTVKRSKPLSSHSKQYKFSIKGK